MKNILLLIFLTFIFNFYNFLLPELSMHRIYNFLVLYLMQKHRVKIGREVEDLKTLTQHTTLTQCKEVTWRS